MPLYPNDRIEVSGESPALYKISDPILVRRGLVGGVNSVSRTNMIHIPCDFLQMHARALIAFRTPSKVFRSEPRPYALLGYSNLTHHLLQRSNSFTDLAALDVDLPTRMMPGNIV